MKRIALLTMIMVISMSMAGCTKSETPSTENQTPNQETTSNQDANSTIPNTDITNNQDSNPSTTNDQNTIIDLNDAKQIALNDAKLSVDNVTFTKAEKETDNGVEKYKIEFSYENTKYDYEINAANGKIIESSNDAAK